MGGNLYMLGEYEGINELHAVWDSVVYNYTEDAKQPLDEDSWQFLGQEALNIRTENPEESFKFGEIGRPEREWYKETLELAETYVYPGVTQNEVPSQEYIQSRRPIARRQIAKGGYRLRDLLTRIYNDI